VRVIWKINTLIVWVKWFRVWVSIYIKGVINWFFTFGTSFGVGSGWVLISPLLILYPCFENRGKLKLITKLSQSRENPSNWVWFGWMPADMGLIAMPIPNCTTTCVAFSTLKHEEYAPLVYFYLWQIGYIFTSITN